MESTVTRPAIDVAPTGARPGLAFILALLAIPGSTLGPGTCRRAGFWIRPAPGLSQRSSSASSPAAGSPGTGTAPKLALAAIIIGGLVIAQMVVYSIVAAFFRAPGAGPERRAARLKSLCGGPMNNH